MKFLVDEGSVGLSFELGCWLKEFERQSRLLSEISSFEFGCPPWILPCMILILLWISFGKLRRSLLQTLTEWNSGKSRLMGYWKLYTHRHDSVGSPGDRACTFQCYDRLSLVRGLNTSDAISGWISGELIIDRNTTVYGLKYLILFLTHNVSVFFLVFQSCSNGSLLMKMSNKS